MQLFCSIQEPLTYPEKPHCVPVTCKTDRQEQEVAAGPKGMPATHKGVRGRSRRGVAADLSGVAAGPWGVTAGPRGGRGRSLKRE